MHIYIYIYISFFSFVKSHKDVWPFPEFVSVRIETARTLDSPSKGGPGTKSQVFVTDGNAFLNLFEDPNFLSETLNDLTTDVVSRWNDRFSDNRKRGMRTPLDSRELVDFRLPVEKRKKAAWARVLPPKSPVCLLLVSTSFNFGKRCNNDLDVQMTPWDAVYQIRYFCKDFGESGFYAGGIFLENERFCEFIRKSELREFCKQLREHQDFNGDPHYKESLIERGRHLNPEDLVVRPIEEIKYGGGGGGGPLPTGFRSPAPVPAAVGLPGSGNQSQSQDEVDGGKGQSGKRGRPSRSTSAIAEKRLRLKKL